MTNLAYSPLQYLFSVTMMSLRGIETGSYITGVINFSVSSTYCGFLTGLNGLLIDFLAVVSKPIAFPLVGLGDKNLREVEACEEPLSSDVSIIVISLALGKGKPPAFLKSVTAGKLKRF